MSAVPVCRPTGPRFGIAAHTAEDLAVEMAGFMEVVPAPPSGSRWVTDPKDDPVVAAALSGAAATVTGDRRMLEALVPGIETLTVAEMLARLES